MIQVASFPKSGTTWFGFLMYTCRFGKPERSAEVLRSYPETMVPNHRRYIEEKLGGDLFFAKSHHPYFEALPYREHIGQCIYLVRHPLAVMASMLNHYVLEGVEHVQQKGGAQRFCQWFIDRADKNHLETKTDDVGGWNHHVCSWLENEEYATYVIRYEELRADTVGTIARLNEALGLGFTEAAIREGCALASFENMRALETYEIMNEVPGMFYSEQRKKALVERNIQFVNKGTVDSYKDVLSEKVVAKSLKVFHKGMALAGYL